MESIILKKGKEEKILSGHPWVYDNEIDKIPLECKNGDIVYIASGNLKKIAIGYLNKNSKITIRILEMVKNIKDGFDLEALLRKKIKTAIKKRENIKNTDAKRLIFSEADFLPGLIVDKYAEMIVVQITTLGMDKIKDIIIKILDEELKPKYIYEKSISEVRLKEGLLKIERMIKPENLKTPEIVIQENGIKFKVYVDKGSKTGFYLDQRENREKIKNFVNGKSFLDCFCYTGGFSVYALKYGATKSTGIDISEDALKTAKENMEINNLKNFEFIKADVFDELSELQKKKESFDVIVLDPPPFSKTDKEKQNAIKGYEFLHNAAFNLLKKEGILFTFSCSQNITKEDFLKLINKTAAKSRIFIKVIDFLTQAYDHPFIKNIPETFYLKGVIIKKI